MKVPSATAMVALVCIAAGVRQKLELHQKVGLEKVSTSCDHENGEVYLDVEYGPNHDDSQWSNQKMDVYTTSAAFGEHAQKVPLAIYVHGGAWFKGNKDKVIGELLALRQRGMHVASLNYRLSAVPQSMSGPNHEGHASHPMHIQDVELAIAYFMKPEVADQYNIDTRRVVIMGASAGGHLASLAGTRRLSHGVRAVVNFFGSVSVSSSPSNPIFKAMLGCSDVRLVMPGTPCYEAALDASPVTHVSDDNAAFLSLYGENDANLAGGVTLTEEGKNVGGDYTMYTVGCPNHEECHKMSTVLRSCTDSQCNADIMYDFIASKLKWFPKKCKSCSDECE